MYTEWLVVVLSLTTLPPLLNAPGGILKALNVVRSRGQPYLKLNEAWF